MFSEIVDLDFDEEVELLLGDAVSGLILSTV